MRVRTVVVGGDQLGRHVDQDRRQEGGEHRPETLAGEVLDPLTVSARLARRDSGRARRVIVHQRRFDQPASKRFRPLLFMRSDDFPEALELFRGLPELAS